MLNRYAFCIHSNQLDIGVRQKQEWSDTLGIATIISLTEAIAVGKMGSLQGSLIPRTLFTGNPQGTKGNLETRPLPFRTTKADGRIRRQQI
ncbi:MAG: hypothetical protein BRC34_06385 [Cyanobacteria bacterium QH_1_48_107]|nr:MAG: hypothetical protein BRC34_06385 [Cyanobacteria bacterium QH_1_48_107]PSO72579.1 MAG: hypothetical protein BRC37_11480 [Cyanobacteria bacterium QH_3_48_40]